MTLRFPGVLLYIGRRRNRPITYDDLVDAETRALAAEERLAEVADELEKLPRLEFGADPDHPGFTQLEPRADGRFLNRVEVLAALKKEDSDG